MTKAEELLALADEYEDGLNKMIRSGYEEFGPTVQRNHRMVIDALRLAAQADAQGVGLTEESNVSRAELDRMTEYTPPLSTEPQRPESKND